MNIKKILKIQITLLLIFSFTVDLQAADIVDDFIYISPEKEKKMGQAISKQVEKQYDAVEDPFVQERFDEIGQKVAAVCDRQEFVYHFKVLKAGEGPEENYYNAFALPGGYVYMFDKLMEELGTDDKIAAVVAHEIGHICGKHVVRRLQGSLGASALMLLAMVTANDPRSVGEANQAIGQLMMAYSREDEFEADKLSVKYLKDAGFNPEGVVQSLYTLKELRKDGREMRYRFYKSHPYLSERISAVRTEIKGYMDFDSYINIPADGEVLR